MQEVPPFDVPELLACLVRQSSPFLDQLGIDKGMWLVMVRFCSWCRVSVKNYHEVPER